MFALGIRKLLVISLVGGIFLLANVMFVAHWLSEMGVIDWAVHVRKEFLNYPSYCTSLLKYCGCSSHAFG